MRRRVTSPPLRALTITGWLLALLGPVVVTGALYKIRDRLEPPNVALVFLAVVVAAALAGGRWPGAVAALGAAAWFDLAFIPPYRSLDIAAKDDAELTFTLLVMGLLVVEMVMLRRRVDDRHVGDRRAVPVEPGVGDEPAMSVTPREESGR